MAQLYMLTEKAKELYNTLMETADTETGEIDTDISQQLDNMLMEVNEKAVTIGSVYRAMTTEADDIDKEIKRLQAIKKRIDTQADNLKEYLSTNLQKLGIESIQGTYGELGIKEMKGMYANISFRNSERCVVDEIKAIPEEYLRVEVKPDLTAIKKAIKSGEEIDGAHIETVKNIQIK